MHGADRAVVTEARSTPPWALREALLRHALLLIVCTGAVVRFATIGTQGFWVDELATVAVIRRGPLELLESVSLGESNPGLYYLLAAGWERVFGSSEIGIRSLSALLGTATIPVVYAAANTLSSRRAGLIAAALTATSPVLIWYSQEARNYELLVLLCALSFLFFVKALRDDDTRWLWAWLIASALALNTHYFALFLLVPEAVWLVLARRGTRVESVLSIAALASVVLALLPILALQREHPAGIGDLSLSDRLLQVPAHFLVGLSVPWPFVSVLIGIGVGVVFAYAAVRVLRVEARAQHALFLAGSVAMAGFTLAVVTAIADADFLVSRNLLELWVPFAVAIAAVFGAKVVGSVGPLAAAALCIIGLALSIWNAATPQAARPDWADLAARLGLAREQRVIVSQSNFSAPLVHYLDGARTLTSEENVSASELVLIEPRRTNSYAVGPCWWMWTCGGNEPGLGPAFEPPGGFRLKTTGSTELFDYEIYTAPRPIEIRRPPEYVLPRVFVQAPA